MFELQEHQLKAIKDLGRGKVLIGDVGSGKSITALAYFQQHEPSQKIVVITTAKKRDGGEWFGDAMKMSLNVDMEVDSWNNIKKYEDRTDTSFIFDEQRLVGNGAWVNSFLAIAKKNHWILLSATPADVWNDLVPVFLANGFFKNRTEFNNSHVMWKRFSKFPSIERYLDEYVLERYRKLLYVEMPMVRHTIRHEIIEVMEFDKEEQRRIWTDRWNIYDDVPIKDAGEMMRLLRTSTNSHPSRYQRAKEIVNEHDRVIIFYNHNHELESLRALSDDLGIYVGEWNGHRHDPLPEGDRWAYLVQYTAGAEGWNCTTTNRIVFYSLPYGYRVMEQSRGRIDRMNTPYTDLFYHVFRSRSIIDVGINKSLLRKKNFHASSFAKKSWERKTQLPGMAA